MWAVVFRSHCDKICIDIKIIVIFNSVMLVNMVILTDAKGRLYQIPHIVSIFITIVKLCMQTDFCIHGTGINEYNFNIGVTV